MPLRLGPLRPHTRHGPSPPGVRSGPPHAAAANAHTARVVIRTKTLTMRVLLTGTAELHRWVSNLRNRPTRPTIGGRAGVSQTLRFLDGFARMASPIRKGGTKNTAGRLS